MRQAILGNFVTKVIASSPSYRLLDDGSNDTYPTLSAIRILCYAHAFQIVL